MTFFPVGVGLFALAIFVGGTNLGDEASFFWQPVSRQKPSSDAKAVVRDVKSKYMGTTPFPPSGRRASGREAARVPGCFYSRGRGDNSRRPGRYVGRSCSR